MIETVAVVGLGAVGVLYATQLQAAENVSLRVIADAERIARYQREGVLANGQPCSFAFVAPEEAGPVDLLIFCTKAGGLKAALGEAAGACGPQTTVISFLNGVSSERVIDEALHPAHLLYATVQGMDATRVGNDVRFGKRGWVAFGERDGRRTKAVEDVAALFDAAGVRYEIPDDIIHQQWSKWMLNVGVNQACAFHVVSYEGIQREGPERQCMIAAMDEARAVAAAEGITLTEAERDAWVGVMDGLAPEGEPSMRQDTRCGRPTEVALFAGVVCELGRRHAIPTPVNDAFLARFAG